jgi:hypothetical protein
MGSLHGYEVDSSLLRGRLSRTPGIRRSIRLETEPDSPLCRVVELTSWRRARGFVRNLRAVFRRAGMGGVIELIAARALPDLLSYRRLVVLGTSLDGGDVHPELRPRRVDAPEPATDLLHTRLGWSDEPDVSAFTPAHVARRLAAGQQLWLFHVDGRLAHARWLVPDRLYVAGRSLRLEPGEFATEGAVTLPEFRGRGLAVAAREHLRSVLGMEGGESMFSVVNGVNRRFLAAALAIEGVDHLATLHVFRVAGRQWVGAVRVSPAGAGLLARGGLA